MARMIAIEGPDKHGKATQAKMLAHALRRFGDRVKLIEVPFDDRLTHKLIYKMLRNGSAKRYPNVFQCVQFINKLICQFTYLAWLQLTCDYIVLDRWSLSAVVYGDESGANRVFNRLMYYLLSVPYITIILKGTSFKRNSVDDVFEKDSDLQEAIKCGYSEWAYHHFIDCVLVDNVGDREVVHDRIMKVLQRYEF